MSHQHTPLDAPGVIGSIVAEELPELGSAIERVAELIRPFLSFAHVSTGEAAATVLNQATNDLLDVLFDCSLGRGRSALRSARSLFELAVTARDIRFSEELAERYMDHRFVIAQVEARMEIEAEHLPRRDRSADLHRRKKLARETKEAYQEALAKYGSAFERQWSPESLRTRAERYGLEEEYAFFRLASAVLHGSAGGALGHVAEIEERRVHRVGPALLLCPMALLYALLFYEMVLDSYGEEVGGPLAADLRGAIREVVKLWPQYRRAVLKIDRKIWPQAPPAPHMAVFAFKEKGRYRRWYLHDIEGGRICEARPPTRIPEEQRRTLEYLVERAATEADPSELITIAVFDVKVAPKRGAPWIPDTEILPRRQGDFEPREIELPEGLREAEE